MSPAPARRGADAGGGCRGGGAKLLFLVRHPFACPFILSYGLNITYCLLRIVYDMLPAFVWNTNYAIEIVVCGDSLFLQQVFEHREPVIGLVVLAATVP